MAPDIMTDIWVSYSIRSLDDSMNKLSICLSIPCQGHNFWQFHFCPVSDIIQPLPFLTALPSLTKHIPQHQIFL